MMLTAGAGILAGQLNPLPLYLVDGSDVLVVRADHIHVLFDLRRVHDCFLSRLWQTNYAPDSRLPWVHAFFSFLASAKIR
jgi:hypothetical protein